MERKVITEEMKQALLAPLPDEAISQHPTKTFLSTIKAIYVTERLNDVFGVGSWKIKTDFIEKYDKMVVVKTTLEIPEYGIYYESFGGNDNQDLGDAYKGATTDAITKIGSYLGIGIDVFKGKHTPQGLKTKNNSNKPKLYEENSTDSKDNSFTLQNNNVQVDEIRNAESLDELKDIYIKIQNIKSEKAKAFLTGELTKRNNTLLGKQQ